MPLWRVCCSQRRYTFFGLSVLFLWTKSHEHRGLHYIWSKCPQRQCRFCSSHLPADNALVLKPAARRGITANKVKAPCSLVILNTFIVKQRHRKRCVFSRSNWTRLLNQQKNTEQIQAEATEVLRGGAGPNPVLEEWIVEALIWRNTTKCARIHSKFKHLTQMFDISWNSSVHLCNSYVKPEQRMRSDPWRCHGMNVSLHHVRTFLCAQRCLVRFQVDVRCSVLTAAVRFSFNKRRKLWIYMIKVCRQRNIKPVWVVNKPSGRGSATRRTNCCFSVSL